MFWLFEVFHFGVTSRDPLGAANAASLFSERWIAIFTIIASCDIGVFCCKRAGKEYVTTVFF